MKIKIVKKNKEEIAKIEGLFKEAVGERVKNYSVEGLKMKTLQLWYQYQNNLLEWQKCSQDLLEWIQE